MGRPESVLTASGVECFCNVAANCMALVAMDSAFSLLEVDRVCGEVPVNDGMAVQVEIESFLANGCCGEDEGPKWRVEGCADKAAACFASVV